MSNRFLKLVSPEKNDNDDAVTRFKFDDLFDPENGYDGWVLCWCLAQQGLKTFRDLFLRLNLGDPSLDPTEEARYRSLHFDLSAALIREGLRLIHSREKHATQLAEGPEEFTAALEADMKKLQELVESKIGDKTAMDVLRDHRDNVFHLPIDFRKGVPEKDLKEAMIRVSKKNGGIQELRTEGTIGTTDLTFTRSVAAALLGIALDVPRDDPADMILVKQFEPLIKIFNQSLELLDAIAHQLVRLQLLRKGFATYEP